MGQTKPQSEIDYVWVLDTDQQYAQPQFSVLTLEMQVHNFGAIGALTASSYHQYLADMECLTSGEAKRRWRKSIKDAWDNRCCFCGQPPISDKSLTIDHLKPRSKGGEDISHNCLPACLEHNQSKGSNDWKPWFRAQNFYSIEREAKIIFWLKHSRLPSEQELQNILKDLAQ